MPVNNLPPLGNISVGDGLTITSAGNDIVWKKFTPRPTTVLGLPIPDEINSMADLVIWLEGEKTKIFGEIGSNEGEV